MSTNSYLNLTFNENLVCFVFGELRNFKLFRGLPNLPDETKIYYRRKKKSSISTIFIKYKIQRQSQHVPLLLLIKSREES